MEFILASVIASPTKIPFLLRFGVPALLIICIGIGVATLVVLIKRSIKQKRNNQVLETKDEDETPIVTEEDEPIDTDIHE